MTGKGSRRRRDWVFLDNPKYAGKEPRPLRPSCHDGTPSIDVLCSDCGGTLHLHESQLPPEPMEIAARCPHCPAVHSFKPGHFEAGFAKMRADGWLK